MNLQIRADGRVVFEPKNEADLKEWVRLNTHKWKPTCAPYIERGDGRRFDLQRSDFGKCVCNTCLLFGIPVQEIDQHECTEWWDLPMVEVTE